MKKQVENLTIRPIEEKDCKIISEAFKKMGWNKPVTLYQRYVQLQKSGERAILIATINGEFAGYLTIQWISNYLPFKTKKIPEIVDFNVLSKFRRKGIGTAIMDEAERRIKQVSDLAGIGFGVMKDYGMAQILYIKRGYIPDGNGMLLNGKSVEYGEVITINHSLVFCLTKRLI